MSGGSWDYVYSRFQEVADRLCQERCPDRRALGRHLQIVAKAMHDIEWVDSCDYARGSDLPAIKEALKQRVTPLEVLIEDARQVMSQLEEFTGGE